LKARHPQQATSNRSNIRHYARLSIDRALTLCTTSRTVTSPLPSFPSTACLLKLKTNRCLFFLRREDWGPGSKVLRKFTRFTLVVGDSSSIPTGFASARLSIPAHAIPFDHFHHHHSCSPTSRLDDRYASSPISNPHRLMGALRVVRPQLGAKQRRTVTDTLPYWVNPDHALESDESKAFARRLTSPTAKTVPRVVSQQRQRCRRRPSLSYNRSRNARPTFPRRTFVQ